MHFLDTHLSSTISFVLFVVNMLCHFIKAIKSFEMISKSHEISFVNNVNVNVYYGRRIQIPYIPDDMFDMVNKLDSIMCVYCI